MPDSHEIQSILQDAERRMGELTTSLDLEAKKSRLGELDEKMGSADFWNDQESALAVVEERKGLTAVVDPVEELKSSIQEFTELYEMAQAENDAETLDEVTSQITTFPSSLDKLETLALLGERFDKENCFFSIHTGAGGSDACEWAEMLLRMYTRYFERKGWKVEELSFVAGEEAGIKGVDLRVEGTYAFGYLKAEMGVHRLVRISPFSGRRETSFAAIDVVPDFKQEIDIEIEEKDLRIDTYRSSGKGGQHVNKTDSAVRITHLPTGIVVAVQNERSQHSNRAMAMKILKSRLLQKAEAERMAETDARNANKSDNAWGSQIRNYVMHPYQMVKDVRTTHEDGDIQSVLDGEIDPFIESYLRWRISR